MQRWKDSQVQGRVKQVLGHLGGGKSTRNPQTVQVVGSFSSENTQRGNWFGLLSQNHFLKSQINHWTSFGGLKFRFLLMRWHQSTKASLLQVDGWLNTVELPSQQLQVECGA